MFTLSRKFIRTNDRLVEVIRDYPEDRIKDISLAKEYLNADIVLRNNGRLYFCEYIQEAEIIEEIEPGLLENPETELSEK